jgi:hypothetical protein
MPDCLKQFTECFSSLNHRLTMNKQLIAIFILVAAIAAPSVCDKGAWKFLKQFLTNKQDAITKKVQAITKFGEDGRLKKSPEYVDGNCKPVVDVLKGKYDPQAVAGKWYAVLQSNDIFKMGAPELLNPNRFCVSYEVTPTADGLQVQETSYADPNATSGKEVALANLVKTKEGTATFRMDGSENGFTFAQLTAAKADDYAAWYFTRQNGNNTCTMKMAVLSRAPTISVDSLLAFHDVVLLKNLKQLNIHPRLFHVDQESCPAL